MKNNSRGEIPALSVGIIGIAFALGALAMFLYMDLGSQSTDVKDNADEGSENQVLPVIPQREGFSNSETPPPEKAKVVRVFDGMTIGLDSGHVVRYLGVILPSIGQPVQCFGKEALMANEGIVGKEVRLEMDPVLEKAQDGAWVRYVWASEGDGAHETLPSVVTQGPDGEYTDEPLTDEDISDGGEMVKLPDENAVSDLVEGISDGSEGSDLSKELAPGVIPVDDKLNKVSQKIKGKSDEEESEEEEVKEYLVSERIIELGLGFPLISKDMIHHDKLFAAARFSSATKRGLWSACEASQDDKGFWQTNELTECVIKGVKLVTGDSVYRTPECQGYKDTTVMTQGDEEWFCSVEEAEGSGFEKAEDCG